MSVKGPITDSELRDAPLEVDGPLTDTELRATPVPVSGPLTNAELRAAAIEVLLSGGLSVVADAVATGTLTANAQEVVLTLNGRGIVALQVTGVYTGTCNFQGSVDGTNYAATYGNLEGATRGPANYTTNGTGIWFFAGAGFQKIRVLASGWGAGTATITLRASTGAPGKGPIGVVIYDAVSTTGGAGVVVSGGAIGVKTKDAAGADWNYDTTNASQDNKAQSSGSCPRVSAYPMVWDGTNYQRAKGTANEGLRATVAPLATSTITRVNDSATSVQLLAANANRIGAVFFNDSDQVLYLKLGTTASATDFTVKIGVGAEWALPFRYTGRIDGLWAADSTGAVQITELAP